MKRVGGIFDSVWDRRTLSLAAHRASRGKRNRPEVRAFLSRFYTECESISAALRSGTFAFEAYRSFAVRDTKTRAIHAPSFRDRVVHHAMIAAAGPVLERGAIGHSYACRQGRGHHAALLQAARWVQSGSWFGKMDVEKFYDSVDHALLLDRLARRFRERRFLQLWERLLASYETTPGRGIPIGALTSQYLGNFVLDEVDHAVKGEMGIRPYLRYMDDSLCIGESKEEVLAVRGIVSGTLGALGLRLKQGGQWNRCDLGVPWVGFVVYPGRIRLNAMGRRRLRRKVKILERNWERGRVSAEELQSRVAAVWAHAEWADDVAWRQEVCRFSRWKDSSPEEIHLAGPDPEGKSRAG